MEKEQNAARFRQRPRCAPAAGRTHRKPENRQKDSILRFAPDRIPKTERRRSPPACCRQTGNEAHIFSDGIPKRPSKSIWRPPDMASPRLNSTLDTYKGDI